MLIRHDSTPAAMVMTLVGRFDAYEVPSARVHLYAVVRHAARTGSAVDLDVSGVWFIDSRALTTMIDAQAAARRTGVTMKLAAVSDPVRTVLELTRHTVNLASTAAA